MLYLGKVYLSGKEMAFMRDLEFTVDEDEPRDPEDDDDEGE